MKAGRIVVCSLLLILPVALVLIFDQAAWNSKWSFLSEVLATVVFLDLPIALCMCHWFRPQWFWGKKPGHYSPIPWLMLMLISWGYVAGEMYLSVQVGHGPENGMALFCAYCLGWLYIWFTMIPIGALYLIFREAVSLFRKWRSRVSIIVLFLSLLFLTGGCCTISSVSKDFWCQTEHRTENRKFKFDPETRQLEFTGTETEIFYCFPFDFRRTIPCWKTVRHHHLTYPVGTDTPPPGSARMRYRIVFTDKARRFKVEKTGLPYLPYFPVRFSGGRPPDWREIAAREKEFLRIHPEDRKYLSGPFELREFGYPLLLIPAGRKDDRYCFYLPDENDLLLRPSRIESHPAVFWRAVWVVPSIAVDLVFWPVELLYLAFKGI